jgi:hypothetical protein
MRTRLALAGALALGLAVPAAAASVPVLTASVGPGYAISLTAGGKPVRQLRPGVYALVVADRTRRHNFHLKGRGVDVDSGIMPTGTRRYTVRLRKGVYTFVCDPHAGMLHGNVRVG